MPKGLQVFPESGYAIVRVPNAAYSSDVTRDSYLAQAAAFHSRTHKHCDDLSFIWHELGQPILVDAGRYGYIGKTEPGSELWQDGFWYSNPMRVFMESTRAHNTLEFDGRNSQRKGARPYRSALVRAHEIDGLFYVESRCRQHRAIWHDRLLIHSPGQWLIVFDAYTDNQKAVHDVNQWLHLAPGHRANTTADGFDVALSDGGQMAVRRLLAGSAPNRVISGRLEEPVQGWFSEYERKAVPADALSFRQSGNASGVFATLLTLSPCSRVIAGIGRTNVTGRRAQIGWSDCFGRHSLSLNREKEFAVAYNRRTA